MTAQFSSASRVEAPRWGSKITPECWARSRLGKSQTYLASCLFASPSSTADSSTTPLREKFSNTAECFIWAMPPASIMSRVASISGTCRVTKWLCLSSSVSCSAFFTVDGRLQADHSERVTGKLITGEGLLGRLDPIEVGILPWDRVEKT